MTPDLIYLVEIDAYDPGSSSVVTLRFASGLGMVTSPSETPPNAHFAPLLTQPINFTRTAFSDARVMGGSDLGYGEIRLNNADQTLSYMLDYGIDGRAIVVRIGLQGAAYPSGFTTLLTGTAEQLEAEDQEIIIRLRDRLAILDEPIQPQKYGGTNVLPNGVDGVADDIKDQEKPQGFGRVYHAPAPCVNTARLIYGLHSPPDGSAGTIQAVDAVYDMAVALTAGTARANLAAMEANEPSPGYYDWCLSPPLIRLGAAPLGRITVDFRGEATGSYPSTVAGIVKRILLQAGVSSGDIDDASFTALDTAAPYEVGLWAKPGETRLQAIERLLLSCGAWLAPDRLGVWRIGQLIAPSGTPAVIFTDAEIETLKRRATNDAERGVPVYKATLRYKQWQATFGDGDIAGSITSTSARAELMKEWRSASASDTSVQTKHLLAGELKRDTCLTGASDAATETARVLALHKVRRDFVEAEVTTTASNATVDLGTLVELRTSRLDYADGRLFRVVGITADGARNALQLDLWG